MYHRPILSTAILLLLAAWSRPLCQTRFVGTVIFDRNDNDFLAFDGRGTDRYYTAGKETGVSFTAASDRQRLHTVSVRQRIYTAEGIFRKPEELTGEDYPYNGISELRYRHGRLDADGMGMLRMGASAGTTGRRAYGREMQDLVHRIIGYGSASGWPTEAEAGWLLQADLEYQRMALDWAGGRLSLGGMADAGTIFNGVSAYADLLIGSHPKAFHEYDLPPEEGSSLPRRILYLIIRMQSRVVFYNRLLKLASGSGPANGFANSTRQLERLLFGYAIGIQWQGRFFSLTVLQHGSTREFHSADPHRYGEVGLSFHLR